jgi:hypothetical protein
MKIHKCRSCNGNKLKKIFNLGNQKLTGFFLDHRNQDIPSGSLSMVFCESCKLLQLENSLEPTVMYGQNYGYMSSLNKSMLTHLKSKSHKLKKIANLKSGDLIIDIGSNDGSFLGFFEKKYKLIGIDPTIKKLKKFYRKDIVKIDNFFEKKLIRNHTNKNAKIITSISMFYDLENPQRFSQEVYDVLQDDGIWHLEQSYMPMMLKHNSYDTICHEHLEYYSLTTIKNIFDKSGFKIIDLEFNNINGGSFAITLAKKKSKNYTENSKLVNWLLKKEDIFNYNHPKSFQDFFENVQKHKKILRDLLLNLKDMKKNVIGYGASTKGNVILQYCNINSNLISYVGEVNKYKFNKFTPGSKIKIISESKARLLKPDYFLVLPWHFKSFIINKEKDFLSKKGRLIFPLPDIEII